MIRPLLGRHGASGDPDRFADALLGLPTHDPDIADDMKVISRLTAASDVDTEPDREFVVSLRASLIANGAAMRRATPASDSWTQPRRGYVAGPRLRFALATFAVALAMGGGLSLVSEQAVPGDSLYAVKRGQENAKLAVSGNGAGRGEILLDLAHTRLDEAMTVNRDGRPIGDVLDSMRASTIEGVRLLTDAAVRSGSAARLADVRAFLSDQRSAVAHLVPVLSGQDLEAANAYLELLDAIDKRIAALEATLSCGTSGSDILGPLPGQCSTSGGQQGYDDQGSYNPSLPSVPVPPLVQPGTVTGGSGTTGGSTGGTGSTGTTTGSTPLDKPTKPGKNTPPPPEPSEEPTEEPTEDPGGLEGILCGLLPCDRAAAE